MYSKKTASAVHNRFWETFGKYMAPVLSASGGRIHWLNYQTGIKPIVFRMHVTTMDSYIGIEIMASEMEKRNEYFHRFCVLKTSFEQIAGSGWKWEDEAINMNGEVVSRIFKTLEPVNINNQNDWPVIISFLKPHIISLDAFWHIHFMFFEIYG